MALDVRLLTVAEVSALFRVDPSTVARWADTGKLGRVVQIGPGGHRRFYEEDIRAILAGRGGNS